MTEILAYGIGTGLSFFGFVLLFGVGLFKRKIYLIILSLIPFIASVCLGIVAGYKTVSKSYVKIVEKTRSRTGPEIYNALLGEPLAECVVIENYQDQILPKIDYAIWLHFRTCPQEMVRILSERPFRKQMITLSDSSGYFKLYDNGSWFQPDLLGDTILVFEHHIDNYGNGLVIYSNLDSTEVFCADVWD